MVRPSSNRSLISPIFSTVPFLFLIQSLFFLNRWQGGEMLVLQHGAALLNLVTNEQSLLLT
jgi:hypothetical protein